MIPPIRMTVLFEVKPEPVQMLALTMAVLGGACLFCSAIMPHALASAVREKIMIRRAIVRGCRKILIDGLMSLETL